ncbi:MAG: hypothetical protein AAF734_01240 [Bacteroidota bacterium]
MLSIALHLKLAGISMLLLSMIHIIFPRYFHWKNELAPLSLINRQLMYVHTFFVALVVFLIGALCTFGTNALLLPSLLARYISLGLAAFWGLRLFFQLGVYSRKLWQGKAFETSVHILFTFVWVYYTGIFIWIYIRQMDLYE